MGRVALAFAALVVLAGCGSTAKPVATTSHEHELPKIRETFTPLPCNERTTNGQEGCAERQILRTDGKIRAAERAALPRLSRSGSLVFVREERTWLAYRGALCNAEAFGGGSEGPVAFGRCVVAENRSHLSSLPLLLLRLEG